MNSLRRKIVVAYGAIAALVVGLSVFSVVEMRLIETQIAAGERVSQFLGIALELRRFEKNYFLYRQTADLEEARGYVALAQAALDEHGADLSAFEAPARMVVLREALATYATLMAADADTLRQEARIRQAGKEIVTIAEEWSRKERLLLQGQIERHRTWLLGAIAVVAAIVLLFGQMLAWRVARPLRQMEDHLAAVAAGRLTRLDMPSDDREIASLTQALNRMLDEIDLRQGQLVRSEKLAALGTLLSGVAHELNNPLSNVSTSCEILKEEVGSGPAEGVAFQQELLDQIDAETWRARRIVRSLLDYARDRDFRREEVLLAPLVEECLRLMKARIPASMEVKTGVPADLSVSGDKQRLQQALFNLIGNALDAVEGAGTIAISARRADTPCPADTLVFGQCPGRVVEIEVHDDGHGIAADLLPRIFDPFFTTKEVGHGLGLGLFIVFEIVEEHGGCIAVQSVPGRGTTFLLRFPAKDQT